MVTDEVSLVYPYLSLAATIGVSVPAQLIIECRAPSDVVSLETCFASCKTEGSAMIQPLINDDMFGCRCNAANTIEGIDNEQESGSGAVTCGGNAWFTYTHSADATASGLAKKALRERLVNLRNRNNGGLCPFRSKACQIPYSDTYECIDTTSEFESCGGCTFGEFQPAKNATMGTNCSALPGIVRGAVTCSNSRCEAFACRSGFKLVSGVCVAA
uniref:Protein CPL1-like domain-containing protein n=1 Tax=Kwoniella dejecticola CBS 10117 TaxID=1296121 RepID=A0A1A5ZUN9_9TREE|nr:uncharacterized protein I303_08295 [Kwoniella dejecticola CBS 10117]OBR81525.1 hypothetical protein I303_08295 [Kwoniella dejecticola CBS 10117]